MRRYTRGMPCEWRSRGRSIPTRRTRFTRCVMRGLVIRCLLNVGAYTQRPTYCKSTPVFDPSPTNWLCILLKGALNRVDARISALILRRLSAAMSSLIAPIGIAHKMDKNHPALAERLSGTSGRYRNCEGTLGNLRKMILADRSVVVPKNDDLPGFVRATVKSLSAVPAGISL